MNVDTECMMLSEEFELSIPDGFSIVQEEKPVVFFDPSMTEEENAILNLEVTPEIEEILFALAKEQGQIPEPLVEDEIDDSHSEPLLQQDFEKCLDLATPLIEQYFSVSRLLDKAVNEFGWAALNAAKADAWSIFNEEMEWNWTGVDAFDAKADKRLTELGLQNKAPTSDQWRKFSEMRTRLVRQAEQLQETRRKYTYGFYQKAMRLTEECREFWKTPKGKAINVIRDDRKRLYSRMVEPDERTGLVAWDFIPSYFRNLEEELTPYFTNGDVEAVDNPEVVAAYCDSTESYLDSHLIEERKLQTGDVYWEKWYARWLERRDENRELELDSLESISYERETVVDL
jgi:hypothetical protein